MPKTRKVGGGTRVQYFEYNAISTDPNTSPEYKSCGVITTTSTMGINMVRKFGTNLLNGFGQYGFELSVYEDLKKESMEKLETERQVLKIDRISSLRIEYIETPSHLVVNCYGTALKKNVQQ